jgi:putative sigma-54 modulation protein
MEPKITLRNLELNGDAQQHIERNLSKLARHLPNIEEIKVDLSEQATKSRLDRFLAQLNVSAKGVLLRSEERGDNLLTALDKAIEVMDRQIEHYKGKLKDKSRNREGKPDAAESTYRIVNEPLAVKQMSADEAIEQMGLSDRDFFLFQDAAGSQLKLVYKRKDGDYGLIEPLAD